MSGEQQEPADALLLDWKSWSPGPPSTPEQAAIEIPSLHFFTGSHSASRLGEPTPAPPSWPEFAPSQEV